MNRAFLLVICLYAQALNATEMKPLTLKECTALASEVNKNVPMAVDAFTTLETTFCTAGKKKPVLNYRAYMRAEKAALRDLDNGLAAMKRQQANAWCTDPEQLKVIQVADIRNIYYDINRKYVGEIDIRFEDCALTK